MQEYWWPGWPFTGVKERDRNTAWAKGQVKKKKKTLAKWDTRCPAAKPKFHATLPEGVLPDSGTVGLTHFLLNCYFNLEHKWKQCKQKKDSKHPFCQIFQYPLFFTTMAEGKRRKFSKLAIHHLQLLRAAHFSKCWRRLLSFCFCK